MEDGQGPRRTDKGAGSSASWATTLVLGALKAKPLGPVKDPIEEVHHNDGDNQPGDAEYDVADLSEVFAYPEKASRSHLQDLDESRAENHN